VKYLSQSYHNLFFLSKGLKESPYVPKYFNSNWFFKSIIIPDRNILTKHPIVETINGKKQLFDNQKNPYIIFPLGEPNEISKSGNQKDLYDLLIHIFPSNRFALKKINQSWIQFLWKECLFFNLQNLCKLVQSKRNMTNLIFQGNPNQDKIDWLNSFFDHIFSIEESSKKQFLSPRFEEYMIYPNQKRESIAMQIIWDKNRRELMTQRDQKFSEDEIKKIISSPNQIKDFLRSKNKNKEPNSQQFDICELKAQIVSLKEENEELKNRIWTLTRSSGTYDNEQQERNLATGYQGEAFVFKQLKKHNQIIKSRWMNKSEVKTPTLIHDFENEQFYIDESRASYDLLAKTIEGSKIYVEVKSRVGSYEHSDMFSFSISYHQLNFLTQDSEKDIYLLARVFSAHTHKPRVCYFILTSESDYQIISKSLISNQQN
jgi:hypothetical protein